MRKRMWFWILPLAGVLWLLALEAGAQEASVGAALRSLSQRASGVFVGQVVTITRKTGVVEIVFRVDGVIAGAASSVCTLREWAGLWPPGMERYHVGDRAMVFLGAASSAGLATPVNGAEGVVPVVAVGGGAGVLLDVSRLETRVVRATTAPLNPAASGVALADAVALVRSAAQPSFREPKRVALPGHHALPSAHVPMRVVPAGPGLIATPVQRGDDAR